MATTPYSDAQAKVGEIDFRNRCTTALLRHAHFVLALSVSEPITAAEQKRRDHAHLILRIKDREQWFRAIAAEPNLDPDADASVESKVQVLFDLWADVATVA